jgi:hypothetical protein
LSDISDTVNKDLEDELPKSHEKARRTMNKYTTTKHSYKQKQGKQVQNFQKERQTEVPQTRQNSQMRKSHYNRKDNSNYQRKPRSRSRNQNQNHSQQSRSYFRFDHTSIILFTIHKQI